MGGTSAMAPLDQRSSIKTKLRRLLLLASGTTLLLSSLGFAVNDWLSLRRASFDRLAAQAQIIGNNTAAALMFGDRDAAGETLDFMRTEADIVAVAAFDSKGRLFANYHRKDGWTPLKLPPDDSGTVDGDIYLVSPIRFDGEQIGHIFILSDLGYWKQRQWLHLLVAGAVFLLSLFAALLLSSRLQRLVSAPILKLAETARHISEARDYRLRAEKTSSDEIGSLVDDFNNMLDQIQLRDRELRHAREDLEEKVQARTGELTELTRQLKHQAYHDTLTGLANRITFDDHLEIAIDQAWRYHRRLAVLFLDLDRFKVINDTLGHGVGDRLLIEVSKRLAACLRATDTLARLGGDEFAILLTQIEQATDAAQVAEKLTAAMAEPVQVDGYSLHVTTSIGISLYPEDGEEATTIVKNADTAMYRSKDQGRNRATFFSAEMNARTARRLMLENKLREAIRDRLFQVHYQARIDTGSLAIVGVEALVRWYDAEEGEISPTEFIPLAEECGLVAAIDETVLETACEEVLRWYDGAEVPIRLSINLSPAQFIREDLQAVIAAILERTGFPGRRLEFEITESLFGPDSAVACEILETLRQLDIELSIDDFGTAYSSLSRLKQLPLHTLKVDQSFIRDLGHDPDDETLVRTIITMAHNLNLKVVAEGIENELQFQFVQQHGCDEIQGFLFGKPVPGPQMLARLRQGRASIA